MLQIGPMKSGFRYLKTEISKYHDFWIFEPVEPRIYPFCYSKTLKPIIKNLWGHPWKYCFCKSANHNVWTFAKVYVSFVVALSILNQFVWRREPGNDEDPCNRFFKILDMNFISIKKWTGNLVTFVFSSEGIPSTPHHSDSQ